MTEDSNPLVPFYVTRKKADGTIGAWSIGVKSGLRLMVLAQYVALLGMLVAILWLCIAVVLAVKLIVGWF